MVRDHLLLTLSLSLAIVSGIGDAFSGPRTVDLVVPGALPVKDDSYLCTSFRVRDFPGSDSTDQEVFISKFVVNSTATKVHHLLIHACSRVSDRLQPGSVSDCGHHSSCDGDSKIIFAWAKDAPPALIPDDVGFRVGGSKMPYIVLEVHYAHPLDQPDHSSVAITYSLTSPKYYGGIYLLIGSDTLPPGQASQHVDMSCFLKDLPSPIHMFAFRTHAHVHGTVISGYKVEQGSGEFQEIARGNPQKPQMFYPMKREFVAQNGDLLVVRCTFNTTGEHRYINMGMTAGDEMCNLYIMFYTENKSYDSDFCTVQEASEFVSQNIPNDSDWPLEVVQAQQQQQQPSHRQKLPEGHATFVMPGARPETDDSYLCSAFEVKDWSGFEGDVFLTNFEVNSSAKKVHHILVFACERPFLAPGKVWSCAHHATCNGKNKIMYAWAKDAPPAHIPRGVGFKVGPTFPYVVLQVHYKHPLPEPDYASVSTTFTTTKPPYFGGIQLLLSNMGVLPPQRPVLHIDANCQIRDLRAPLSLFAFRTHAHVHGVVITGYKVTGNYDFVEIARGDPQRPQMFYPMKQEVVVQNGDVLAARCTFNTTGETKTVHMGMTAGDEMCNLYLMYYTEDDSRDFSLCSDSADRQISARMPKDSDWPLSAFEKSSAEEAHKENPISYTNGRTQNNGLAGDKQKKGKGIAVSGETFQMVRNWPAPETKKRLGQVCGVAVDIYGNPTVFHRGDRVWDFNTFNSLEEYKGNRNQPIPTDTILTLDARGNVQMSWGANTFFMPHTITVDAQNNVWVTDVALHQVFKFLPYGGGAEKKPVIILGEKFKPGNDDLHYCKPTAVAVADDGKSFFVSDGYCNSRIIKYSLQISAAGYHNVTKLLSWGRTNENGVFVSLSPYALNVPHSLALATEFGLICVADRENGRIQCYKTENGEFVASIAPPQFGRSIYGVAYSPVKGGRLYAVGGPEPFGLLNGKRTQGYEIDMATGEVLSTFNAAGSKGLQAPHDLAVSKNGSELYVVELNPFVVWKFAHDNLDNEPIASAATPATSTSSSALAAENSKAVMKWLEAHVPSSNVGVIVALVSLTLTVICSCGVMVSRCRKRGRGSKSRPLSSSLSSSAASSSSSAKVSLRSKSKAGDKKLGIGGLLGRSRNGFQPLRTEDDGELLSSDTDVEEFSVPSLKA